MPPAKELTMMLKNVAESGYIDRGTMYKMSFIKGVLAGFGGVIGATIVVALLMWILTAFNDVPVIGPFADKVYQTVQHSIDQK